MLATTDIVLPVSDEMDCKACHTPEAGTPAPAMPQAGWSNDPDPQRAMRLNILRKHDDRQKDDSAFTAALAALGVNAAGLYATVTEDGQPVLCAACHASAALGTKGQPGAKPLTEAVHTLHAYVYDPLTGSLLNSSSDRAACYRCHPGSLTRCLRGVMGASVAPDGALAIQCQECHGTMSIVRASGRLGWLEEPLCQSCHTGTATHNNGELRYTSAFDSPGHARVAVDDTFATTKNAPAEGLSLYRLSFGHGGLACEACHGSTHAEYASTHESDNVQSVQRQGHEGLLVECTACHGSSQSISAKGGPHGMHTVGQRWVGAHPDIVEASGAAQCKSCHGTDYRGTVLSRAKAVRTLTGEMGTKQVWAGFQIGCYTCHRGPSDDATNPNRAPAADDGVLLTVANAAQTIALQAHDADGDSLTLRIVSQPKHGTTGLNGRAATFTPAASFAGEDSFTFAAWDGSTDSNLATVSVVVGIPACADPMPEPPAVTNGGASAAVVTASDALYILRAAVETVICDLCVCDVNGSGQTTASDALATLRIAVG